jgi:hypothetical protein
MRGRARASRPARQHLPSDDLVILCRRGNAEAALHHLREIMGKLKLTVNEDKTRICKIPEGEFDFLGYTFGRMYSPRTGQARLGQRPSKKVHRQLQLAHDLAQVVQRRFGVASPSFRRAGLPIRGRIRP